MSCVLSVVAVLLSLQVLTRTLVVGFSLYQVYYRKACDKKTPNVPTERKKPVFFNVTYESFLRNVELHKYELH